MKKHLKYYFAFILIFLFTEMPGQYLPHILKEETGVFGKIERHLINEKVDSVLILSDIILKNENKPKRKAIAIFYRAQAEQAFGQFDFAHRSYDEAIELFKSVDFEKGLAMVNAKKADLYHFQKKLKDASLYYDRSIQYAKRLNLFTVLIDVYQKKASIHFAALEQQKSIHFLKEALHYALLNKDDDQSINIINQISTNYHTIGELDSAINYFQKSLQIKQNIQDTDGQMSDYSALGNLYRERGDYENAQQQLMRALKIAETEQDSFSITTIYTELGDIYTAQSIWNVAENYYNKALKIARLKKSRFMEAACLKKLGKIFHQQNKNAAAIENYEAALEIYTQLKNKVNTAEILVSLSELYKNETDFDKIKVLLEETLKTSIRSPDVMSTLSIKLALAQIEIRLGNYNKGISYAEECLKAYRKMEDRENLKKTSLLLSEAYSKTGDFRKAYHFQRDYSMLKDSLVSVELAEAIKKYDLLITTKKKDEEISRQNEKIQNQELALLRKNNQVLLLASGLGLITLLTILMLFVYYKNKQLNQQRIQFMKKEQETQRMKAIIEGEEKERKRFAQELHDGLGAVLGTVKMQISGVGHKFPDIESSPSYQKAESLIDEACRTVREVSHDLMPHVLEQQGLIPAIDDICQSLSLHQDMQIDFIPYGDENELNDVLKITLYRITQELLKNVIKHAEASEVIVQLTIEDDEIILIVEDNGKGFDPKLKNNGIGIENINSRTAYLNGSFDIDSSFGQGSTFTIIFPSKH